MRLRLPVVRQEHAVSVADALNWWGVAGGRTARRRRHSRDFMYIIDHPRVDFCVVAADFWSGCYDCYDGRRQHCQGGLLRVKAVIQRMIYREDTRDHPQYPPISLSASNRRSSFFFNLSSSKSPGSRENHTEAEKPGLPASSHLVIGPTLLKTWRSL